MVNREWNSKFVLRITKVLLLTENLTNNGHEVFKAPSVYEVPIKDLVTTEDLYEFYKDAELNINQAYHYAWTQIPLPAVQFPPEPMESAAANTAFSEARIHQLPSLT